MGLKLVLLLSHLALLLVTSFSLSVPVPLPHPPAQSPSYPVPLPHPTPLPSLPPVKPPTKPPTLPPVKPPTLPPVKPPTKPPTLPPVKPPTLPPVKPPTKPPTPYYPSKKPVAIQGVVFCKNCTYFGVNTLVGAKPLANATVSLKCKNVVMAAKATTDKNGYFFMQPPKVVGRFVRWCRVQLVAPPPGSICKHATNLNGGAHGGYLKPEQTKKDSSYALYTVGPFAFEPSKRVCRKH